LLLLVCVKLRSVVMLLARLGGFGRGCGGVERIWLLRRKYGGSGELVLLLRRRGEAGGVARILGVLHFLSPGQR
jgi:hypothetical protein